MITKQCKKHGMTGGFRTKEGWIRCKKCRNEAVSNRRRKTKAMLVDYAGGKCGICGYNKCQQVLQFHHLDPKTKEFALGADGICRSWERMKREADKCILLCANCHAEVENGIVWLTGTSGNAIGC